MSNQNQQSVTTPVNSSIPVEREPVSRSTPEKFQEGYWQGHDRAVRDYANLASQPAAQNNPTPLPGILLGMLIATVVGGSTVAFLYFDNRLDTIVDETETLTETLQERETASEEGERSEEVNLSSESRFDNDNQMPTNTDEPSAPTRSVNPSSQPGESAVPSANSSNLEQIRDPFFRSESSASPSNTIEESEASQAEESNSVLDMESAPDISE